MAAAADGPYTIDGTVPDDAGFAVLQDDFGSVKELGPRNGSTTKIGVIHDDSLPTLGMTNPNAQVDLRRAWLDTDQDGTTGDDWLYFAWERDANNGSGFIAYEFMQNPVPDGCAYDSASEADLIDNCNPWENRTAGDFLILWDQQGNSTDLYVRKWTGPDNALVLSPLSTIDPAYYSAAFSDDGFFGEAAVNLTQTIFGGSQACLSFANTIPSTVTGNSDTADYKDTILKTAPPISNCTSTTVTTPKLADGTTSVPGGGASIGTGVLEVKDSAVVDIQGGSSTPAGSLSFYLCKLDSGTCTTGGTSIGSSPVTDVDGAYPATVVSPSAFVTSAGRYCWRAEFSGDAPNGIPASSDSSATECFTVNPVTPSLSTTASADVLLGSTVSDTATLSGLATQPTTDVIHTSSTSGAPAGGSITFTLYGPDDCSTVAYTSTAVSVSGNDTYNSPSFEPQAAGTYHWVASYSGNGPNNNSTSHNTSCNDTAEDVVVSTVPSTMTTAQKWLPNDSAEVSASAGGDLAGKVKFEFFTNGTCSGSPEWTQEKDVAGASPQTVTTTNSTAYTASGDFSWRVSYDSTNAAQDDIAASCEEVSSLTINNNYVPSP